MTPVEKQVYIQLKLHPKHLEDILEETGLSYNTVVSVLEQLSCRGVVKRHGQAYYSLEENNG